MVCVLYRLHQLLSSGLSLVEVADSRVSRLHCTLTPLQQDVLPGASQPAAAQIQDLSRNGTFLNGSKMVPGTTVQLTEGDVISLVLAMTPFARISYTFRRSQPVPPTGTLLHQQNTGTAVQESSSAVSLARNTTSEYVNAAQASLDDLECPICYEHLKKAVALEPCGHSFCAVCLAQHFGQQLQSDKEILGCPYR